MTKVFSGVAALGERPFDFKPDDGRWVGKKLNEDFFALALGPIGNPASPIVYIESEKRFYRYIKESGIYEVISESAIIARLSVILQMCGDASDPQLTNIRQQNFSWRKESHLRGIVKKAEGRLAVPEPFFETGKRDEIICANGIFSLATKELLPFSPDRHFRNRIDIEYDPTAQCPQFMSMVQSVLLPEDVRLLQQWGGMTVLGSNRSQKLLYLYGEAGAGKSTLAAIILGIVGKENATTIRTAQLSERFEMARFNGKTLLTGLDVPVSFLNQKGATIIKTLTGGDAITGEMKFSTKSIEMTGNYNLLLTSNERLKIYLEGDHGAWKRRLLVLHFRVALSTSVIAEYAEKLLSEEAKGILKFFIDGALQLYEQQWRFELSNAQNRLVSDILDESLSVYRFGDDCLDTAGQGTMTTEEAYERYKEYCHKRKWNPEAQKNFGGKITKWLQSRGIYESHDIKDSDGDGTHKGWRGLALKFS